MVKIILVTNKNYEIREIDRRELLGYMWDKYKIVDAANMCEIYVVYINNEYRNELGSAVTKNVMYGDIVFVKMDSEKMIDISIEEMPELTDTYNNILIGELSNMNISDDTEMTKPKESEASHFNKVAF